MLKLIKYEFRKSLGAKLVLLGITAVAEIFFLVGAFRKDEAMIGISAAVLSLITFCGLAVIGVNCITRLRQELNSRQSYMLFLTPNSSYRILGAKVLESGLSILLTGLFFFALFLMDASLLVGSRMGMLEFIREILKQMEIASFTPVNMLMVTLALLTTWFFVVVASFLAVTISAAVLNGRKWNQLLSFGLFILILVLQSWSQSWLTLNPADPVPFFLIDSLIAVVWSAVMYIATAFIMDRKLSV